MFGFIGNIISDFVGFFDLTSQLPEPVSLAIAPLVALGLFMQVGQGMHTLHKMQKAKKFQEETEDFNKRQEALQKANALKYNDNMNQVQMANFSLGMSDLAPGVEGQGGDIDYGTGILGDAPEYNYQADAIADMAFNIAGSIPTGGGGGGVNNNLLAGVEVPSSWSS